ncbi:Precorrin-8X methylmutase [Syntrophobacter sp. SbD1]|nr:Precorrin-8X methylmutase [Syntrophobacter sp. SbD1]
MFISLSSQSSGENKLILQFPPKGSRNRSGLVKAGREIEQESFRIIEEEMGRHSFPHDQWPVIRRVIHTTGDFDYAQRIHFTSDAVARGIEALKKGAAIYTDTRMIRAGLSPWRLEWHSNEVVCPAENGQNQKLAEKMGVTRTLAAFRNCASGLDGAVIAIGNAPTALLEVIRLIDEEGIRPGLVIGVPVGFVQAEESKNALLNITKQPSIAVLGRKGGSSVAVAIIHALLELAKSSDKSSE